MTCTFLSSQPPTIATNPRLRRRSGDTWIRSVSRVEDEKGFTQRDLCDEISVQSNNDPSGGGSGRQSRRSESRDRLGSVRRSLKRKVARVKRALSAERPRKTTRASLSVPDCSRPDAPEVPACPVMPSHQAASSPELPEQSEEWLPREKDFICPKGMVLRYHPDGTKLILLERFSNQPFGIYVKLALDHSGRLRLILSQMENESVEEYLDGILNIGDELVAVERRLGSKLSLDELQALVEERRSLRIRVRPRCFRQIETDI